MVRQRLKPRFQLAMCLVACLGLHLSARAQADATVTITPFPSATTTYYPVGTPPPNLPAGEDGAAVEGIGVVAGQPSLTITTTTAPDGTVTATITVTGPVPVSVSATENVILPKPSEPPSDADKQLAAHEAGHVNLDANDYAKNAAAKAAAAFRGFKGSSFTASAGGANAKATAISQATAALSSALQGRVQRVQNGLSNEAQVLSEKYDDLTNHGLNDRGGIDTAAKGVAAALAETNHAPQSGTAPNRPNPSGPRAMTAPDPAQVAYDAASASLVFGGDLMLHYASDASDSIIDRGIVSVDPLPLIGLNPDGSYWLGDGVVRITDVQTGDLLLKAYLLNPAYMPSTLPGYAGMIEGYLDIPPDFTGAIDNAISSEFLQDLAVNPNLVTNLWFYADQPLFDSAGALLVGSAGIGGSLKIASVPEAPSLAIVLLELSILVILRASIRRRRATHGNAPVTEDWDSLQAN